MIEKFEDKLRAFGQFNDSELELALAHVRPKRLRKRQVFLNAGEICKDFVWIMKGCLRMFLTNEAGKRQIVDFGLEDSILTDQQSILSGKPSLLTIDAVEDSEVILLNHREVDFLTENIPMLARRLRSATSLHLASYQNRITMSLALSADEKYRLLIEHSPEIVARVPQHMLASYLGMAPATLSRICSKYENASPDPSPPVDEQ